MYARLVLGDIQPGKVYELVETFRGQVTDHLRQDEGLHAYYFMTDTNEHKLAAIAIYDSEEQFAANTPRFQERSQMVQPFLNGPPTAHGFEVAANG